MINFKAHGSGDCFSFALDRSKEPERTLSQPTLSDLGVCIGVHLCGVEDIHKGFCPVC